MSMNAHLVCGVCADGRQLGSKPPRGCVTPGGAGLKA